MAIVLKPPTLNEYRLNAHELQENLNNVVKRKQINPKIKNIVDIYERSTAPPETTPSEQSMATTQRESNPTKELITFLINRNREDANDLKLTHFRNIRCKDNNNKSCIVPIYKTPENREDQNKAEQSNLLIHTINYKYFIFIRDIYNITYKDLMERMDGRYKINVGLFKE